MTTITIKIDSNSVKKITNAGQLVTLVQMVNSGAQSLSAFKTKPSVPLSSNTCIIWGVSQPYQDFDFTWTESYYWYFSTTRFKLWNIISTSSISDKIRSPADVFRFSCNSFSCDHSEMDSSLFQLHNFDSEGCFGLAQDLIVNNAQFPLAPVSGINALNNELVQCSIQSQFAIILSSYNEPGKVITSPSQSSYFTINHSNSLTLKYDGTNTFVPTSL